MVGCWELGHTHIIYGAPRVPLPGRRAVEGWTAEPEAALLAGARASEARNEPTECDSRQREIGAVPPGAKVTPFDNIMSF